MKKIILFIHLFVLYVTTSLAQVQYTVQDMTFKLPTEAVKIESSSLALYSNVQQRFIKFPNIYKVNNIYLGIRELRIGKLQNDHLVKLKTVLEALAEDTADFIQTDSKIETINSNKVLITYDYSNNYNIGNYDIIVMKSDNKQIFAGRLTFEGQSNFAVATKILYDFLNTVVFPYGNTPQSRTFYRNNCGTSGVGSAVPLTIPANTFTSTTQADADAQAIANLNWYPQSEINALGTCTYSNKEKSGYIRKNNCPPGSLGSSLIYVVPVGKHTSTISEADADAKAQIDFNTDGQNEANTRGSCLFKSKALSNVGFRKICIAPKVGTIVYYSAVEGTFTSFVSQADADLKAQTAGQNNANLKGICR